MIAGVGDGTFAMLVTIAVVIILAVVGSYLVPDAAVFIIIGCLVIPFVVYGCIVSAPRYVPDTPIPYSPYREHQLPANKTDIIDKYLPVRIVVFLLLVVGVLAALGLHVVGIISGPAYTVPKVRCLREQLEEAHPTWYR